jgi:hypothetical protein
VNTEDCTATAAISATASAVPEPMTSPRSGSTPSGWVETAPSSCRSHDCATRNSSSATSNANASSVSETCTSWTLPEAARTEPAYANPNVTRQAPYGSTVNHCRPTHSPASAPATQHNATGATSSVRGLTSGSANVSNCDGP